VAYTGGCNSVQVFLDSRVYRLHVCGSKSSYKKSFSPLSHELFNHNMHHEDKTVFLMKVPPWAEGGKQIPEKVCCDGLVSISINEFPVDS